MHKSQGDVKNCKGRHARCDLHKYVQYGAPYLLDASTLSIEKSNQRHLKFYMSWYHSSLPILILLLIFFSYER